MAKSMLLQFEEYDRKIFWVFATLAATALFLYAYFISISIVSVIERKGAERELGRMTAQVATLESQYVLLDRSIDLNLAHAQGFVDIATPKYLGGGGDRGGGLTLRETIVSAH